MARSAYTGDLLPTLKTTMVHYRVGWVLGVGGKLKAGNTIRKGANSSAMSSVGHRTATVNLVERDGRQQQFDTPSSYISAHWCPIDPLPPAHSL